MTGIQHSAKAQHTETRTKQATTQMLDCTHPKQATKTTPPRQAKHSTPNKTLQATPPQTCTHHLTAQNI